ncbi:MAG: cephalosporin hydroxylase family protein [Desulfatibacillaceae bacterium]|nr:cephalosporin hydroxylase family protein [Desulfatibacillaceae bacterium]
MEEGKELIAAQGRDRNLYRMAMDFIRDSAKYKYTYHFTWMGVPIIQLPQDMVAMQEIIWDLKPELIIETGVAHGGSLIFYASMLELIGGTGQVLGIDIDIREHNRKAIETHPMFKRITLVEGSSVDPHIVKKAAQMAHGKKRVLVALDSNHTHEHVLQELHAYSGFVTPGSYLVVFDTAIEDMPPGFFGDRPWDRGDNPKTAVFEFLKNNNRFEIDFEIQNKLLLTVAPEGYLKCVR